MTLTLCGTHKAKVRMRTAGSGEQLDSPVSIIQLVKLIPLRALSKPDIAVAFGVTGNTTRTSHLLGMDTNKFFCYLGSWELFTQF
jgi:hypothetical protein